MDTRAGLIALAFIAVVIAVFTRPGETQFDAYYRDMLARLIKNGHASTVYVASVALRSSTEFQDGWIASRYVITWPYGIQFVCYGAFGQIGCIQKTTSAG